MNHSINRLLSIFLLTLILAACGNQDKKETQETSVAPETVRVAEPEMVFENQYAKVVKVSLAPGEALAAHEGKKRMIYSLVVASIGSWLAGGC
jgi:predicted component of type VI protein secretion system